MAERRVYQSDKIAVSFDPSMCIHTANCIRGLPHVFDLDARPWIDANGAAPDDIAAQVRQCPSGALQYERFDGGEQEPLPDETLIVPLPDGPNVVRGNVEVRDADGELIMRSARLTLCRCGGSQNKPFCDNTHLRNGFRAP